MTILKKNGENLGEHEQRCLAQLSLSLEKCHGFLEAAWDAAEAAYRAAEIDLRFAVGGDGRCAYDDALFAVRLFLNLCNNRREVPHMSPRDDFKPFMDLTELRSLIRALRNQTTRATVNRASGMANTPTLPTPQHEDGDLAAPYLTARNA
jgi:hypothetical protein